MRNYSRNRMYTVNDCAFVAKSSIAKYARDNIDSSSAALLFGVTYAYIGDRTTHAYNFHLDESLKNIVWYHPRAREGREVDPGNVLRFATY